MVLAVVLLLLLGVARVPFDRILRRSVLALPFLLVSLPGLVLRPGEPIWEIPWGKTGWMVTETGLTWVTSTVLKAWLSVQAAGLLVTTTSFPDLLMGLRSLWVPRFMVATLGLLWRYLFLMAEQAEAMRRARQARIPPSAFSLRRMAVHARLTGQMAGTLLVRSLERAQRVHWAMVSRGYDGEIKALRPRPVRTLEYGVLVAGLLFLWGVASLGRGVSSW